MVSIEELIEQRNGLSEPQPSIGNSDLPGDMMVCTSWQHFKGIEDNDTIRIRHNLLPAWLEDIWEGSQQ